MRTAARRMRATGIGGCFLLACLGFGGACEKAAAPASMRFLDVTQAAGLGLDDDVWGTFGAAWGDYDHDGHVDLFVSRHSAMPALLRNTGQGTFVEQAKAAGMDAGRVKEKLFLVDRHGCAWGDYDADGDLDLYCATGAGGGEGSDPNQLFRNDGEGRFTEVAAALGVDDGPGRGRAVHWIDYDRDGRLDLYVANTKRSSHPSRLYRGVGSSFRDVTEEAGLADEEELIGGGSSWCDYDADGFPDLVLGTGRGLLLRRNLGNGKFAAGGASLAGLADGPVRSVTCGDLDQDGTPDLFVATLQGDARVLRNRGDGTFVDATGASGIRASRAVSAVFADLDNDGDVDLFVVRGYDPATRRNLPDMLFASNGAGQFVDVAKTAGVVGPTTGGGDSAAVADYDGDGFLDLLVTNGACQPDAPDGPMYAPIPSKWFPPGGIRTYQAAPHGAVSLFRNQGNDNHWIGLKLRPGGATGSAYGTVVVLRAGSQELRASATDGLANYGQSERTVRFGLGRRTRVDEVRIRWPDGSEEVRSDLEVDRVVPIVQEVSP